MAEKSGQTIPETWAVKADGSATTSPSDAIAGMLLPVGGPKGFGLAFVIDLLCGLLSGGASGSAVQPLYGDAAIPYDTSHLFIAIDVGHFGDPATVRAYAAVAADRIRSGKRAGGVSQLFAPGEPEWRNRELARGQVVLSPAVAEMLTRMAREMRVSAVPIESDDQQTIEETGHAQA
jgi:LDH2 family malate/lactate/ureidoglycolate dehydrogenase